MGQKKLKRFAEIKTFPNAFEYPEGMKGKWNEHFKNNNPITLELACGKGEYAVGLGKLFPERNFIGVDIKSNRMWVGAKQALEHGFGNVAFLRTQIERITEFIDEGEVAEIWITFPDPQLKFSKFKKRLTHPRFLRLYKEILGNSGFVHLKTDSPNLHEFTKMVIELFNLDLAEESNDIYAKPLSTPELGIQTHYEKLDIAQSNRIHYLKFNVSKPLPKEKDEILKTIISENEPG